MPIRGHGIDIVATARIADLLDRHGERLTTRCFTDAERAYCEANRRRRVAAKEAVLKALGTGWSGGITWQDVAVERLETGEPRVVLTGRAAAVAAERGIERWWLSLSHIEDRAVASVVAEGGQ